LKFWTKKRDVIDFDAMIHYPILNSYLTLNIAAAFFY